MIFVDNDKEKLLLTIGSIKKYLSCNLYLKLHPKKIYLQHHSKGVNFLGAFIKPYKILVGKRFKNNFYNRIFEEIYVLKLKLINKNGNIDEDIYTFAQLVNSYLGILGQSNSYIFRKTVLGLIIDIFDDVFVSDNDFHKITNCCK
jgi:hypothetical protein